MQNLCPHSRPVKYCERGNRVKLGSRFRTRLWSRSLFKSCILISFIVKICPSFLRYGMYIKCLDLKTTLLIIWLQSLPLETMKSKPRQRGYSEEKYNLDLTKHFSMKNRITRRDLQTFCLSTGLVMSACRVLPERKVSIRDRSVTELFHNVTMRASRCRCGPVTTSLPGKDCSFIQAGAEQSWKKWELEIRQCSSIQLQMLLSGRGVLLWF